MSLVISFITAVAAVAVAVFSWRVPMILREEKFKEILYGRKFAAYDQLLAQLPELVYLFAHVQQGVEEEQRLLDIEQLADRLFKFKVALEGAAHILPDKFYVACTDLRDVLGSYGNDAAGHVVVDVMEAWVKAVNIARADQAVEKLTKGIGDSLQGRPSRRVKG